MPNSNTALQEAEKILGNNNVNTARIDALALIEFVSKKDKAYVLSGFELTKKEYDRIHQLAAERASGAPLAYLLNSKEFYGRDFYVNPSVLIPRPESEDMISLALELKLDKKTNVIDIGTGSGILGITYAKEKGLDTESRLCLFLSDISDDTLAIAKRNARAHKVRAQFIEADLLADKIEYLAARADGLVLANLPYVPDGLVTSKEIKAEPALALFSGEDGLGHYRGLFEQISTLQSKPMYIVIECLTTQFDDVDELAKQAGYKLFSRAGLASCFTSAINLSTSRHA